MKTLIFLLIISTRLYALGNDTCVFQSNQPFIVKAQILSECIFSHRAKYISDRTEKYYLYKMRVDRIYAAFDTGIYKGNELSSVRYVVSSQRLLQDSYSFVTGKIYNKSYLVYDSEFDTTCKNLKIKMPVGYYLNNSIEYRTRMTHWNSTIKMLGIKNFGSRIDIFNKLSKDVFFNWIKKHDPQSIMVTPVPKRISKQTGIDLIK